MTRDLNTVRQPTPAGRLGRPVMTALMSLAMAACGDGATEVAENTIAAERFVAVYVDLRVAALSQEDGQIKPEHRDSILSHHGVSDDDLFAFAELHGGDAIFMRGVWDSVEVVYQRARTAANEAERAALAAAADSAGS